MTILLADDGRPGSGLWRIFPCGGVAEVSSLMSRAEVEALTPHPTIRLSHLSNVEPYEVLTYDKCPECGGKGYVDCLVIQEWDDEGGGRCTIGRFYGEDMDDVRGLKRGQSVGMGTWDCDECGPDGYALTGTGLYVERDALVEKAAA